MLFFSLLDKSTRITESSSTLIDHFVTNITKCKIIPGIIDYQITDHLPTFVTISNIKKHSHNTTKFYQNMKQFHSNKFCQDLQISLEEYFCSMPELDSLNFNDVFHHFVNTIKTVINTHAPLKQCSRRQKRLQRKSWISKGLYVSIRKKQKLYKTHYLRESNNQKAFYKRFANLLTKLKTAAKKL